VRYGRGTGPGTAAHWEAQPPVVAQGAAAALRTRPLPQPTASSLVVESFILVCASTHVVPLKVLRQGEVLKLRLVRPVDVGLQRRVADARHAHAVADAQWALCATPTGGWVARKVTGSLW
jgi:hypothetical protein